MAKTLNLFGAEAKLNTKAGDLTILVISHRASSLAVCTRWLSIEHGRVAEVEFAKIGTAS